MAGRLPIIQPAELAGLDLGLPLNESGEGKSVHFVSLGCPKNRTDSEAMLARLGQAGYSLADDAGEADVIVVNTCTFIDAATEESVDTVLEMAEHRKSGKAERLVVTGCMAQRHHATLRDAMQGSFAELEPIAADAVAATGEGLEVGHAEGPGPETGSRFKVTPALTEEEVGLLQDVVGIRLGTQQRNDVGAQSTLDPVEQQLKIGSAEWFLVGPRHAWGKFDRRYRQCEEFLTQEGIWCQEPGGAVFRACCRALGEPPSRTHVEADRISVVISREEFASRNVEG